MADKALLELKQELAKLGMQLASRHDSFSSSDAEQHSNSLAKAIVYPGRYIEEHAPKLANLIQQSVNDVNDVSQLDGDDVALPAAIWVVYDGDYAKTFAYGKGEHGSELTIGYEFFRKTSDMASLKAVLDHEFGHGIANPPEDAKSAELRSDRYADALNMIKVLVSQIQQDPYHYDYDSSKSTHPNHRERIHTLLEEYFGNEVFRMNGGFAAGDNHFNLKTLNGIALTEDGQKVTNWPSIQEAMAVPVEAAMNKLKSAMNDRALSDDEAQQLMTFIQAQAAAFKAEPKNQPVFEASARQDNALSQGALSIVADRINQQLQGTFVDLSA